MVKRIPLEKGVSVSFVGSEGKKGRLILSVVASNVNSFEKFESPSPKEKLEKLLNIFDNFNEKVFLETNDKYIYGVLVEYGPNWKNNNMLVSEVVNGKLINRLLEFIEDEILEIIKVP
jgi:hypothetical protein